MGIEFSLIETVFKKPPTRRDVLLSIGDDCALVGPREGYHLAISVDTLVSGTHFLPEVSPKCLGHKALAVNLSDLAACGAEPAWCTLAITLPSGDPEWLVGFMQGFSALAQQHTVDLIGGDTTRGPLSVTIQLMGHVPVGEALLRSGAKVGDLIYVSGLIGEAGLGLLSRRKLLSFEVPQAIEALERPLPRVELGVLLRGIASACIDISDGLLADLSHILDQSNVGASLALEKIPSSSAMRHHVRMTGDSLFPLTAGDDYELCFTVPKDRAKWVEDTFRRLGLEGALIGEIEATPGLRLYSNGNQLQTDRLGYEHF